MPTAEELAARIAAALEGDGRVLEAYLFGSIARGEAAAHSDIDVAVFVDSESLEKAAGFGLAAELTTALMSALESNDVDVVILNRATPLLYHRVLRDGIRVLSRDLRQTTVREGQALSRYCDYVPQLRKIEAAARRRAGSGSFGR